MGFLSFFGAIFGFARDALKAALEWLSRRSPAELIGIALAALAIVLFFELRAEKRHSGKVEHRLELADQALAAACAATREAAANPALDCAKMPAQIRLLGEAIAAEKDAIAKQNAAIAALANASRAQQAAASVVVAKAQESARRALTVAERLRASAARTPADPCKPSADLLAAWK